ncbi:MAG: hypothetical protein RLY21_2075 [Planctomycetota bacterium]|jgi:hypothetical protein
MRITTSFATVSVAALIVSMSGCTTRSATFEGYGDDQVWSAMVAAARTPEYDDWKVQDNQVMVDETGKRLEVYRYLKRLYVTPFSDPRKEQEEWRIQVVLSRDESLDAPIVEFTARQVSVPAHVWREADRYFAQLRTLLGPPTASATTPPATAGEETPVPPPLPTESEESGSSAPSAADSAPAEDPMAAPAETPAAQPPEPLPER